MAQVGQDFGPTPVKVEEEMEILSCKQGTEKPVGRAAAANDFGYGFATMQDPSWSLSQVLLATGGRFLSGESQASFRAVSTDTRTLQPGDLF